MTELSDAPSEARPRVLLVDDDTNTRDCTAEIVRRLGYEVVVADNGPEAQAEAFRPDVVLLDLIMPGLNGWDTAYELRKHPWGQQAKLIALTGRDRDDDISKAVAAGFDDYLIKPTNPQHLQDVLV
ncbi:MAG: response regulator [Opitutales bacterium]